ncbi:BRCT domain-containing protein [Trichonephila clavata]|uniref:Telomeric repeat-binding factor 2-interacting protein 1 n=2 Tax=Trichonephila clavata TaxID=2740835 RepID=A0A8X6FLA0_TRICU|nr:BRCT domain-containing protein [Trichonephila clavata]
MTDFQHSIVLFCGDDGLPLEFNIRNTNEKEVLRAIIEYGGGLCSKSENAVHLITPGTKVLNADLGKKLVSTKYIFDCVKENYLLNVNDYVFTIKEANTSDISDEDNEINHNKVLDNLDMNLNNEPQVVDMDIDETLLPSFPIITQMKFVSPNQSASKQNISLQNLHSSNTSESFIESSIDIHSKPNISSVLPSANIISCEYKQLTSTAKDACATNLENNFKGMSEELSPIKVSQSLVNPLKSETWFTNKNDSIRVNLETISNVDFHQHPKNPSPVHTVVSSSQLAAEGLDDFDNLLLSKVQKKPQLDDDECLSQSYTVSSSADAQVGSKPNSEEIFAPGCSAIPDSPTLDEDKTNEHAAYIKNLEIDVQKILLKPSPKSIQDKICLVKYLCYVLKLSPAKVLELLPHL